MRSVLLLTGALLALIGAGVVVLVPDASAAGLLLAVCGVVLTRNPTTHPVRGGYAASVEHDGGHPRADGARP